MESQCGRDFQPIQTSPEAQPASCKMVTWSSPVVKFVWGMLLTTHLIQCCNHGRVELYLYSPSGPHQAFNGITLPFLLFPVMFTSSSSCTICISAISIACTMRYCCFVSDCTGTSYWCNIRICVFVNLLSIDKKCALLNKCHFDHVCSYTFSE